MLLEVDAAREAAREPAREAARKTFDPSDTLAPVAQAFRSVARLTERPWKGDSPHSLPTHVLGVWARQISKCSRRQGTLFQERLDRNCDGVVSRSEFGAWLYPTRPRDKLKELICDVVDRHFQGKLAKLWARMLPQNPNEIGRLLFVPRLKLLLVDGDFERSFKRKQASREAPFLPF